MIFNISDNIISPLGWNTVDNWMAVSSGQVGLQMYEQQFGLPEPFVASLIDKEKIDEKFLKIFHGQDERYTKMEKMAILSATDALSRVDVDPADPQVVFIFSTTKGNVELLENFSDYEAERPYLWRSAQLISRHFKNPNPPVVISNACISGCAAQLTADRFLNLQGYRYAVVVGVDVLSKFIISGFQSFKALSPEHCRPFDANRTGLNLGEAAATIVYARDRADIPLNRPCICLATGAICNDANHISGPSRTAEGLYAAVTQVLSEFDVSNLAFVNAHGTATRYNDDMEMVAMERAVITNIPVNSLKGYFGHTLGAAGVLEVVLSTQELLHHTILPTIGCENPSSFTPVKVVQQSMKTDKNAFLKMISGFGGGNAALLVTVGDSPFVAEKPRMGIKPRILAKATISDTEAVLPDGTHLQSTSTDTNQWLNELYHRLEMNYPKFFKMDRLSKVGILAAEMVMRSVGQATDNVKNDWGVICFNRAASLDDDRTYQETINDAENYFPSPSVFVYTLANIVIGEMAIKYKLQGETSFYVSENYDKEVITKAVSDAFATTSNHYLLAGWVDYDNGHCEVELSVFCNE